MLDLDVNVTYWVRGLTALLGLKLNGQNKHRVLCQLLLSDLGYMMAHMWMYFKANSEKSKENRQYISK